ncbi:hypothetical protein, partial [Xanthomonas sontii]|uniref:hypothetical protein n=1 Tax=Xanthomonas sontii TaxID=2650745 RepID=UPI001CED6DB9
SLVGSQQSQDENFRLKGATVVSNLAIAGEKKVEQFKNWLGEDNAETAALILMAAAGGPVKTLGSTLWAATPMAGYLQEKKEQYLVNPLTPLIGANAFGAETDRDQQAVQPASHATSSMLVDTLLSSLGVMGTKAGAIGIIKSSDGFSGAVKSAENALQEGSSDAANSIKFGSRKAPVQELDVDSYNNLKSREVVGDGLEHDHIPSFAALRLAKETELGRPLTKAESKLLYDNAIAVEVPREVHVAGETYGGKNTAEQIQR